MRRSLVCGLFLLALGAGPATKPADRVVYFIDGSGSMRGGNGDHWTWTIGEVAKSIGQLKEDQTFGVFVAAEGKVVSVGKGMVAAKDENKQSVWEALRNYQPYGKDGIAAGIERAEKMRPSLVWFVSDGDFEDDNSVVRAFAGTKKKFPVNTLAAVADTGEEGAKERVAVLRKISDATGGRCVGDLNREKAKSPAPAKPPTGPSIFDDR